MKKSTVQPPQDERVLQERRKIQSRGYSLLVLALAASVLIQQLALDAPFSQYAAELFLLLGCGVYQLIAHAVRGLDLWNRERRTLKGQLLASTAAGCLSVLLVSLLQGERDLLSLGANLLVFGLTFFAFNLLLWLLFRARRRSIDRKLDQAEDRPD